MLIDEPDPNQLNFGFESENDEPTAPEAGLNMWRDEREENMGNLGRASGMPLNHLVEVTLLSGPLLRGRLRLAVDSLWIEVDHIEKILFEVDGTPFRKSEIESCVRTD